MVKNMLISLASIMGVFLTLFLVWFLLHDDGSKKITVNTSVETAEVILEADQPVANVEVEEEQQLEYFESSLKIISVD